MNSKRSWQAQRGVSTKAMILFWAISAAAACDGATAPSVPDVPEAPIQASTPNRLVPQGETRFTASVGTIIEPGPAVRVLDEKESPVRGVLVSFFAPGFGSKVVVSDADGIARFGPLQIDTVAREYFITASVVISAQRELGMTFRARATPGPVVRFTAASGNNQVAQPARTLPNQLQTRATDRYNNPVPGVVVTFSVVSGGGSIELSTSTTDLFGVATAGRWTLGTSSTQRVSARAGVFEALFDAGFCETSRPCDIAPLLLAYVRDGAVWIHGGADGGALLANNARRPAWSPGGSLLAYFRLNTNSEEEAICVVEPFSAPASCTPLDWISGEVAPEMRVSWSPDGGTLALSRVYHGNGNSQLLFVDVPTMKIRRHGRIDRSVWSASWSPDGKKMAIASDAQVYLADAAGSGLEVLLPYGVWELAWAPDGQKIAVITRGCEFEGCFGVDIVLLDPKTKELTVLERGQGGFSALAWSPDGKRLAYSAWDTVTGSRDIRIIAITDAAKEIVLTNASDPSWRP